MSSAKRVWRDICENRSTYLMAVSAAFGGLMLGWDTGLIGGVLTMTEFQDSFNLDPKSHVFAELQANIVSVLQGGCFFGAALSFYTSNTFGRKPSLYVAIFFYFVGSVMQTCAGIHTTGLGVLYAGRVIGGVGVGIVSAVVPTYIGESAAREIRGRCIGMFQVCNVTGIMLSFFVNYGSSLHLAGHGPIKWRLPFAIQLVPCFVLGLAMLTQKESPRWLVEKGRVDQARQVLVHLRSKLTRPDAIEDELTEIRSDFDKNCTPKLKDQLRVIFTNLQVAYPVALAFLVQVMQQFTGTNSLNYYAPQIFQSIGLAGERAGLFATGIFGVVKVVATTAAITLAVEQLGRKWCLIIGALGMSFSMWFIGAWGGTHPLHRSADGTVHLTGGHYFSIVCVYLFVVFYSLSWGQGGYIIASECSPNQVRALVLAIALMFNWASNFAVAQLTPILLARTEWRAYFFFASMGILAAVFAAVMIPETRRIPLERMEMLFEGSFGTIVKNAMKDLVLSRQRGRRRSFVTMGQAAGNEPNSGYDSANRGKEGTEHVSTGEVLREPDGVSKH